MWCVCVCVWCVCMCVCGVCVCVCVVCGVCVCVKSANGHVYVNLCASMLIANFKRLGSFLCVLRTALKFREINWLYLSPGICMGLHISLISDQPTFQFLFNCSILYVKQIRKSYIMHVCIWLEEGGGEEFREKELKYILTSQTTRGTVSV